MSNKKPFDMSSLPGDALLTPEETARVLSTTTNTLANWRATERYPLPYVKLGRLVRYRVKDLRNFINRNVVGDLSGS